MIKEEEIVKLEQRILALENLLKESSYITRDFVQSEFKKRYTLPPQNKAQNSMITALCVSTEDKRNSNFIRFFTPQLHAPNTPIDQLPYAAPISALGGFDDSGVSWPPPAGSTVCLLFDNGLKDAAYYIGTTWQTTRKPTDASTQQASGAIPPDFGYAVNEYNQIHQGHRGGYLVNVNNETQVFPPWNTESHNSFDYNSTIDSETETNLNKTYPNIYGFKTPQKSMIKIVDGNYKLNHKNKRLEILSSCGNWLMMKDDHLHDWEAIPHPSCLGNNVPQNNGIQSETTECIDDATNPSIDRKTGNKYFKHQNECRPFKGPGTPQNNKCQLPQSGIQLLSISGHTMIFDDSVEEPQGIPNWEKSIQNFDFGCTNKFTGKLKIISTTGHLLELNDKESDSNIRSDENLIRLRSASGNEIELNDHTISNEDGSCLAGEKRGISLTSTSGHSIKMIDQDNEQCSLPRAANPIYTETSNGLEKIPPISKARKAYLQIKTGYGLEIMMKDQDSQEETKSQYIRIFCPQKDNEVAGPHILYFQESVTQGQVLLRAGGDFILSTHDRSIEVVGDEEVNPSDKVTFVSRNNIDISKNFYLNKSKTHFFLADNNIILGAGKDCKPRPPATECAPCIGPVLVLTAKGIVASDRVFASASPDSPCVSVFQLTPFTKCPSIPKCGDSD